MKVWQSRLQQIHYKQINSHWRNNRNYGGIQWLKIIGINCTQELEQYLLECINKWRSPCHMLILPGRNVSVFSANCSACHYCCYCVHFVVMKCTSLHFNVNPILSCEFLLLAIFSSYHREQHGNPNLCPLPSKVRLLTSPLQVGRAINASTCLLKNWHSRGKWWWISKYCSSQSGQLDFL